VILVQRTDLNAEEEVLVLLHYAGEEGFSRTKIGKAAQVPPPSVTRALQSFESPGTRQIVKLGSGNYRLTDLGAKRIREQLADKLLISLSQREARTHHVSFSRVTGACKKPRRVIGRMVDNRA
jgi:Mn-dependent DtxR family transcriptional regulator